MMPTTASSVNGELSMVYEQEGFLGRGGIGGGDGGVGD